MKKIMTKALAVALAVIMALPMGISAAAVETEKIDESSGESLTVGVTDLSLQKKSEQQTGNLYFYIDKNAQIAGFDCKWTLSDGISNATNNAISGTISLGTAVITSALAAGGGATNMGADPLVAAGAYVDYNEEVGGYVLFSVPVTVEAEVSGTYTVEFDISGGIFDADNGNGYTIANSQKLTSTITIEDPEAHTHVYDDPSWNWTGDDTEGYTAATATFICTSTQGSCDWENNTYTAEAELTEEITQEAAYDADGSKTVTATVTLDGKEYTDVKENVVVPMLTAPERDESGVYLIGTAEELAWFSGYVNAGNVNADAKLTADITVDESFAPIGAKYNTPYQGVFDGQGQTITLNGYSLFNFANATIKNVNIAGVVEAKAKLVWFANREQELEWYTGSLVCYLTGGSVENCHNIAVVSGDAVTGGLIGYVYGGDITITNCSNRANVTAVASTAAGVGGLFGFISANTDPITVTNCYNTGDFTAIYTGAASSVGGLVGYSYGVSETAAATFTNCYSTGTVVYSGAPANMQSRIGTLVGTTANTYYAFINCYYLDTACEASGANGMGTNAVRGCDLPIEKTETQLKTPTYGDNDILTLLGVAYCADGAANPVNGGYPVLRVQAGETVPTTVTQVEFVGAPTKTEYVVGQTFDPTGITIRVTWEDGSVSAVNYDTVSKPVLQYGETSATISITLGEQIYSQVYNVKVVEKELAKITVSTASTTKTLYASDEELSKTGLVVSAYYTDFPDIAVALSEDDYILTKGADNVSIVVSYTYGEKTVTGSYAVTFLDTPTPTDSDNNGAVELASASDLIWFAYQVNFAGIRNLTLSAEMTANIDLTGVTYSSIGASSSYPYQGTFDGRNHTITLNGTPLFNYANANFRNIALTGSIASTSSYTGALVNYMTGGTVDNCRNTASVTGGQYAGGIVGYISSETDLLISNCYNAGNVTATKAPGGILGYYASNTSGLNLMIVGCGNEGNITAAGGSGTAMYAGGIIGWYYPYGEISSEITDCYNTGAIDSGATAGGIAGRIATTKTSADLKISGCYNSGSVTGTVNIGGIVGYNFGSVENCYNTGTVTFKGNASTYGVGGIIGKQAIKSEAVVTNVYNTGVIQKTSEEALGLLGELIGTADVATSLNNSYYLSGREIAAYNGNVSAEKVESKSTDDLKALAPTLGDAFAADTANINNGYPVLRVQVADEPEPSASAYKMYLELSATADADNDGVYDVNPGDTFIATLYVKSDSAQKLSGFDVTVTYDTLLTLTNSSGNYAGTTIDDGTAGKVHLICAVTGEGKSSIDLPAGEDVAIASLSFKVADAGTSGLAFNVPMAIEFGTTNQVSVLDEAFSAVDVSTTDSAAEILTTYEITWDLGYKKDGAEVTETATVNYGETPVYNNGAAPTRVGYDFTGWSSEPVGATAAATYTAQWSAVAYTITYDTGDGDALDATTYTIETAPVLSVPTYDGYVLDHWVVTTAGGNWTEGEEIYGTTDLAGKYGNVTLTAVWKNAIQFVTEDYRYAFENGVLLIVAAPDPGEGKCYLYNGEAMFYTTDEYYTSSIENNTYNGVYVTIIPASDSDTIAANIKTGTGENVTIARDGDMNRDGSVNIGDATFVSQMINEDGSVWGVDQVSIRSRLEADMVTTTNGEDLRGTIADVAAIIAILQGK